MAQAAVRDANNPSLDPKQSKAMRASAISASRILLAWVRELQALQKHNETRAAEQAAVQAKAAELHPAARSPSIGAAKPTAAPTCPPSGLTVPRPREAQPVRPRDQHEQPAVPNHPHEQPAGPNDPREQPAAPSDQREEPDIRVTPTWQPRATATPSPNDARLEKAMSALATG